MALSILSTSCMGRGPGIGVDRALEGSGPVPTIRIAELVVGHNDSIDQTKEVRGVGTIEAGLMCCLCDGGSFASCDRF